MWVEGVVVVASGDVGKRDIGGVRGGGDLGKNIRKGVWVGDNKA